MATTLAQPDGKINPPPHIGAERTALIERIHAKVPAELRTLDQWVCWRLERRAGNPKPTKIPYDAKTGHRAKSDTPDTWAPFDVAAAALLAGNYSGLGFVLTEDDPYTVLDFDDCITDGVMHPERHSQMMELGTYAEYSQSGTGVHIIGRGTLTGEGRKSTQAKVEMYDTLRFIVMTGNHVPGTPATVKNFQRKLEEFHHTIFPPKVEPQHRTPAATPAATPVNLDDRELIDRAMRARNGADFARLWRGDASDHNGDQSAADLALCLRLAWWTNGDRHQMDRLFRQSRLFRPKWDKKHRSDGRTYGQMTIDKALGEVTSGYTGGGEAGHRGGKATDSGQQQPEAETDPLGRRIRAARHWLQRADFASLVPANLQSAKGYRTLTRDKRLASAYLDVFEEYGKLSGPISQSQLILRSGQGSSAVRAGQKALQAMGFVRRLPTPDGNESAHWWELGAADSCVDSAVGEYAACETTRAIYATILTTEKAKDAWQRKPRKPYRDATLEALGPNACLVADCLFDYGQQTPSLISERTHLSKYSVARALAKLEEAGHIDTERQGRRKLVSLRPGWLEEVRRQEPHMTTHGQQVKRELGEALRRAENYAARLELGKGDAERNAARLDKADKQAGAIVERQLYALYAPEEAERRLAAIKNAVEQRRAAAVQRLPNRLAAREELRRLGVSAALAQYPELHGSVPQMVARGLELHQAAEEERLWREVDEYRRSQREAAAYGKEAAAYGWSV